MNVIYFNRKIDNDLLEWSKEILKNELIQQYISLKGAYARTTKHRMLYGTE